MVTYVQCRNDECGAQLFPEDIDDDGICRYCKKEAGVQFEENGQARLFDFPKAAMSAVEDLQYLMWCDGVDTEHNSDTLNEVANTLIKHGFGPKRSEPREKTKEEVLEEFLTMVADTVLYWEELKDHADNPLVSLAMSMLIILDGRSVRGVCGFDLVPTALRAVLEMQGKDWYPEGPINRGVQLHELFPAVLERRRRRTR